MEWSIFTSYRGFSFFAKAIKTFVPSVSFFLQKQLKKLISHQQDIHPWCEFFPKSDQKTKKYKNIKITNNNININILLNS